MLTFAEQLERWKTPRWSYALVALPWLLGLILLVRQCAVHSAIASREQTTLGTIIGHEPHNHDRYRYSYSVAGRSFRAWGFPDEDALNIGEQVVVYYDPMAPDVSSLTDFAERSYQDAGPVPLLFAGVVAIVAYSAYQRRRNAHATI